MNDTLDVGLLIQKTRRSLGLRAIAGKKGLTREITTFELQRPGLALSGYFDNFALKRIQVVGQYEMHYLNSLNEENLIEIITKLFEFPIPCLIFAKNLSPSDIIISIANEHNVPILKTKRGTYEVMADLADFLKDLFALRTVIHGSMVDVYGVGILFRGKSGIGKSECALDLVARGHRLVADDYVIVTKRTDAILMASAKDHLGHFMEIRGIGIIDIEKLYGIHSVRMQKRIELCVQLVLWDQLQDYERIGSEDHYTEILGVQIPEVTMPISPGKDISTLSEVIAMNFMLKVYGENPAVEFLERIQKEMLRKDNLKSYLSGDTE